MLPLISLSSFKFSSNIYCADSAQEEIRQAFDLNGDARTEIYVCNKALFGNPDLKYSKLTLGISYKITDNTNSSFVKEDGLIFDLSEYTASPSLQHEVNPFFINNSNNTNQGNIIIGAQRYGTQGSGASFILGNPITKKIDHNNPKKIIFNGENNYITNIDTYYGAIGYKIFSVGDINQDGLSDFSIINGLKQHAHAAFIYGKENYGTTSIEMPDLKEDQGFTISHHYLHRHIPKAIDLNGDHMPEIIIFASKYNWHPSAPTIDIGHINLFYGQQNHTSINTENMNAAHGFVLKTPNITESTSESYYLDLLNDHTGRGFGKIVVGSPNANNNTGMVRIISGRPVLSTINLQNSTADAATSHIYGESAGDEFGRTVANIGDVNKDGKEDFVVCANGAYNVGACYVFYGKDNWDKHINVADMSEQDGYYFKTNFAVSKAIPLGDFDGDGIDDFAVSSLDYTNTHIIFGKQGGMQEESEKTKTASLLPTKTGQQTSTTNTASAKSSQSHSASIEATKTAQHHSATKHQTKTSTIAVKHTNTHVTTKTLEPEIILTPAPAKSTENAVPKEMATAITTANEAGAAVRVVAANPGTASQGARISAIKKFSGTCQEQEEAKFEFDVSENPTSFISDYFGFFGNMGDLKTATQTLYGGVAILTTFTAGNKIVDINAPHKAHFPGFLSVPLLATITPITRAAALIASKAEGTAKAHAIPAIVPLAATAATYYNFYQKSKAPTPEFNQKYDLMFDAYQDNHQYFMAAEIIMNFAVGFLGGATLPFGSCQTSLYANTAFYVGYAGYLIYVRPYKSTLENAFSISIAIAEATPLLIKILQEHYPDLKENETLNKIVDTLPTIIEAAIIAKSVFDLSMLIKSCITTKTVIHNDKSEPLLQTPSRDSSQDRSSSDNTTPTKSSNSDSGHVAVDMENTSDANAQTPRTHDKHHNHHTRKHDGWNAKRHDNHYETKHDAWHKHGENVKHNPLNAGHAKVDIEPAGINHHQNHDDMGYNNL